MWRGYFAIENLNLNASQRQALIDELRQLGPSSHPQPAHLNHWRPRLDNQAVIFEAEFNDANLTIDKFKQRLGVIFSISPVTIGHSLQTVSFGDYSTRIATFSRTGTDYIRFALFGNLDSTWDESRNEVAAFLIANAAEWELFAE